MGPPHPAAARAGSMSRPFPALVLLLMPVTIVIAAFAWMMLAMLRYSFAPGGPSTIGDGFTLDNYVRFLSSTFYWSYLLGSLRISLYCTLISTAFGYLIAYAMFRSGSTVRLLASIVLLIQFFTAYVIRAYAIMLVIGRNGIVNHSLLHLGLIDHPLRLLFTETGVAIGLVLISVPFMVFPIFASLERITPNIEMASASLGASPFKVFCTVTLPLSLPGVAAGIVIVYLFELTSYIMPGLLGGGYADMIANLIYNKSMRSFEYTFSSAAAVITLAVAAMIVYLLNSIFARITSQERG
jgi:ABC-type spermidine/putrescine transport system permease subunit I